jgi:Polyketide cyclase / dehydrase and lipid transport
MKIEDNSCIRLIFPQLKNNRFRLIKPPVLSWESLFKRFANSVSNEYLDLPKAIDMIFVYIFVGLIATLLVVAALMPKVFNVEKTIVISKPLADVMNRVGDLNYYSQWNPWQQSDPTAKNTITGTPKSSGHKYSWEGKKVGAGSLTLNNMDDKHIHFDLEFLKPWKSKAKDNWLFEPWGNEGETKVTWQNSGELPWPIARLMGPMLNKSLSKQFEQGLSNLKKMVEG